MRRTIVSTLCLSVIYLLGGDSLWSDTVTWAEPNTLPSSQQSLIINSSPDGAENAATNQTVLLDETGENQHTRKENLVNSVTRLFDAVQDNTGIISLNQSSGNAVNQSNVRSFYLSDDPDTVIDIGVCRSSVLDAVALTQSGVTERKNLLDASFQGNRVFAGINQSAGNLNQQSNTALVIIGGQAALSDAELGNTRATNTSFDEEQMDVLEDMVTNSFSNSQGIFQVSQSAGNVNIQENNLAISYRQLPLN